jgi:hypothetical protein
MIRTWAALALLAASWLAGLGYFEPVSWPAWALMVTAAALLLAEANPRRAAGVVSHASAVSPGGHAGKMLSTATFLALLPAAGPTKRRRWRSQPGWR